MLETVRKPLSNVPFARHVGVELDALTNQGATASLPQTPNSVNHIDSQHAGALFTLGETASGAAMAGIFAPVLMSVRPVTSDASIRYLRIANGRIIARAKVDGEAEDLLETLNSTGKVSFAVDVSMTDKEEQTVATMTVRWHISKLRPDREAKG